MWVFLCASDSAGLLRALSSVPMYECVYLCMYQFEFVVCRSISVASQQTPANNRTTTTSARLRLDHDDITWLDIYGGGKVRRIKRYTWASEQLHWVIYWTVITGCAVAQQFYYIDIWYKNIDKWCCICVSSTGPKSRSAAAATATPAPDTNPRAPGMAAPLTLILTQILRPGLGPLH